MTRARASLVVAVAVAVAVVAVVAFSTLSAGAGTPSNGNTVTVNKVVVGPAPAGTTFSVTVACTGPQFKGGPEIITFDAQGVTTSSSNVVMLPSTGSSITCTATETATGGAATVAYACVTTGNTTLATCPDGPSGQTVRFQDVSGSAGVVTVTNTFPVPTATPTPAPEVVVEPVFTG